MIVQYTQLAADMAPPPDDAGAPTPTVVAARAILLTRPDLYSIVTTEGKLSRDGALVQVMAPVGA